MPELHSWPVSYSKCAAQHLQAADYRPATASKLSWQFPHVDQIWLSVRTCIWHPLLTIVSLSTD